MKHINLRRTATILFLAWAGAVSVLWLVQDRVMFPRSGQILDEPRQWQPGMVLEHVTTSDGLSLALWASPPRQGMPVIIYLHGNAGIVSDRYRVVSPLVAAGYGVVLGEWRGYGGNAGQPSEAGFHQDALAFSDWASRRWPGSPQVSWGESIGTASAVYLATRRPVVEVVLDAPFTSALAVAKGRFPFAPVGLLIRNPFDSLALLPHMSQPLLVMHGLSDKVVPSWMGRRVLASAPCPAGGIFLPGVGHTALFQDTSGRAVGAALEFLDRIRHPRPGLACDKSLRG